MNTSLASKIRTEYMKCSILYNRILRARIIPLNNSDTNISVDINSPSKSLKGKYALWLDYRTIDDNRLHGSGSLPLCQYGLGC